MPTYVPLIVQQNSDVLVRWWNETAIVPFEPLLGNPETNAGGSGIWAGDDATIITSARKASDNTYHFYHYEPSTPLVWLDKGVGVHARSLAGSSYSSVWACSLGTVWYWNGTAWVQDSAAAGGYQIAAVGLGAKEQFVADTNHIWIRDGGAIGSGNWVDYRAQLNTDTGLDVSLSVPDCNGVYAYSATQVYWLITGAENSSAHYIVLWNGTSFSIVSTTTINNYRVSPGSLDSDGANLWWIQDSTNWGAFHFLRWDGTTIVRQAPAGPVIFGPEHNMAPNCKLVHPRPGQPSEYSGYAAGARRQTGDDYDVVLWRGGSDWAEISRITQGQSLNGITGIAMWPWESAPYVQNEDPAPDSTGNAADTSVDLEVVDDQGDVLPQTVKIYINGTLAWSNRQPLAGFTGSSSPVTVPAGNGYTIQPADPFEPGTQTVRVTAQDADGNALDYSYSFETGVPLVVDEDETAEEVSDQDPPIGIDLKLDTAHDVVLTDYDLELVAGADEVAQHLLVGMRLFLGEWYLDEDAGVPYYRDVLIAAPQSRVIEGLFRREILDDTDVEALTAFDMSINRATRKLDLDFTAVSKVGIVSVDAIFP